ncbi:DUF1311 domain-containing protein [bacterium]|nr:MAG: DUF1311 domain-containing protein [bacterium]
MKKYTLSTLLFCFAFSSSAADTTEGCEEADSGRYSAIAECGYSSFKKVDAAVESTYKDLFQALREDEPTQKLLVESQAAWKLSRDKTCDIWHSMISHQVSWCQYGMTEARLTQLKHMHACFTIGGNEC